MMKKIAFCVFCCIQLFANDLTWGSPTTLSTLAAAHPRIGMAANGDLVAVWTEAGIVQANTHPFGGSWGSSSALSGMGVTELELVVDPSGNATAIWNEAGVIRTASLPSGGAWGSSSALSGSGSSSPQIAVNSSGDLAAVWITDDEIQAATKPVGMSWSSASTISNSANPSDSPQVDIGDDGTIVAVWHGLVSGVDAIFSSDTTIGASWPTSANLISDLALPSVRPAVAVNSLGIPIATWYRYAVSGDDYSHVIVQVAFGLEDETWDAPTDLSAPGMRNPAELMVKVGFNQNDIPFVLWTNGYDASSYSLQGTIYRDGAWDPITTFVNSNIYLYTQDFMISTSNYVYAAYMEYDVGSDLPIVKGFKGNTYNTEFNYGNILTVSTAGANAYPRIDGTTVSSAHSVAAIWLNNSGLLDNVKVSIATGVSVTAPTSLAVDQDSNVYGVFTEYYNTLTWSSSMPAGTSNWVIFRNGVWLQTLPVATLEFVDHNVEQNGSVTYGVALQTEDGDLSAISTVSFP